MKLISRVENQDCFQLDLEAEIMQDATFFGRLLMKGAKKIECWVMYPNNNEAPKLYIRIEKNKKKQYNNQQFVGTEKPI